MISKTWQSSITSPKRARSQDTPHPSSDIKVSKNGSPDRSHVEDADAAFNSIFGSPSKSPPSIEQGLLRRRPSFTLNRQLTWSRRHATHVETLAAASESISSFSSGASSAASTSHPSGSSIRPMMRPGVKSNRDLVSSVWPTKPQICKKRSGRLHHTFSLREVPYPLACDNKAMDLNVVDQNYLQTLKNTASLIDLTGKQKPMRALDLGCGNGEWILEISKEWLDCHFVGFDVLPVQPDLSLIAPELSKRVEWVQGNFLRRLPFPRGHFDYVHLKSIGTAIPEDKWDFIFSEVNRVLKPGGAVEVVDEDLFWPSVESKARDVKKRRERSASGDLLVTSLDEARLDTSTSPRGDEPFDAFASASTTSPVLPLTPDSTPPRRTVGRKTGPEPTTMLNSGGRSLPSTRDNILSRGVFFSDDEGTPISSPRSLRYPTSPPTSSSLSMMSPRLPPTAQPERQTLMTVTAAPRPSSSNDFAFIEKLYFDVFDRRFINTRPTSIIPNILNIHFRRCQVSAPICRYLPRRSSRPGHAGDSEINLEKPSSDTVGERRDHAKNGTGLPHPAKPRYEGARTKGDTLPPSAAAPSMNNTLPSGEPAFLKGVVEEEQDNPQCETNQESTLPDEEEKLIKHIRHQFNTQQSVALHLHGVLAGIMACRESMWEEHMIQNNWTEEDFRGKPKSKVIQQERARFDSILDRYRSAAQSQISLGASMEAGLKWKAPKEMQLTRVQREALGEDVVEEDSTAEREDTEDEVEDYDDEVQSDEDERKHGRLFRRAQFFCAFKEEHAIGSEDEWP